MQAHLEIDQRTIIMKILSLQLAPCASLSFVLLAATCFAADETKEPPQMFAVRLGDQTVKVLEGETAKLAGSFTNPQLTITPDPYRVFPYQGVRFEYPRTYSFEADVADPDEITWTLSGNDVSIMFFAFNVKLTATEFAGGVMDQFGKANCKILNPNAKLKLGVTEVTGTKIHITIATHPITQEIYTLPSPRNQTKFLVLQDNPDEQGNHSAEAKGVLEMLKKSFQIDGK